MYLRFILLTLIGWIVGIISIPLKPLIVLFANDSGWLPNWLAWAGTPDQPLAGQIQDRPFPEHNTPFKRWWNYTVWLYRNSNYGFAETILGFTIEPGFVYSCEGNENVGNKPLVEGLVKRTLVSGGKTYFQWYYIKAWGPKKYRRCIRINLGWKIWGKILVGDKISIVCSPNPIQGWN